MVATFTRTIRGLQSELPLGPNEGLPDDCVASFDNLHTVRRSAFRHRITQLSPEVMDEACHVMAWALGCLYSP